MLQLKGIRKQYKTGDLIQRALDNVSLSFRDNEFVSVLGHSGSGKTTLLNIIGGLDRYDEGDLIIDGVSTTKYKDADWDYYRNNSIGFIFQSYNLIPHQTVLSNVEMALTLSGVSKTERRERALEVLKKVGLEKHIHKRPNQMSGGQMQRVAIARALINNPDILLADEPTGALDSETSIQIMELLKEIAKEKLVIMVTHNPELAEEYSTRVIKLSDGHIISDSDAFDGKDENRQEKPHKKISMSFMTALSLSFNNLRTKKGRTLLTSFAGAIGIIGIALVLSLSEGINDYIASIQKDTMASYPITISSEAVDMTVMMGMRDEMMQQMQQQMNSDNSAITGVFTTYEKPESQMPFLAGLKENNLTAFKKYLDDPSSEINQYIGESGIVYNYDLSFSVYSYDNAGNLVNSDADVKDSMSFFDSIPMPSFSTNMSTGLSSFTSMLSGTSSGAENFYELTPGANGSAVSQDVKDSYDLLYGRWPESCNEVIVVLNENNEISAETLCKLGYITKEDFNLNNERVANGESPVGTDLSYYDLINHTFFLITASDRYFNAGNGEFILIDENADEVLYNSLQMSVTGVIRPKRNAENAVITTAVAYTSALTDYIINHTNESEIVKAQEANPTVNILSGLPFTVPTDAEKIAQTTQYLKNLSAEEKTTFYTVIKYYEASASGGTATDENTPDLDSMTDSEKAAAFEKWLAEADDETLLALFEIMMSNSGSMGMGQGTVQSTGTATDSDSGSSSDVKADYGDSFFTRLINAVNAFVTTLFGDGSSVMDSLDDEKKIELIKENVGKLSEAEKASFYTALSTYGLLNATAEEIKELSALTSGQSSMMAGGMGINSEAMAGLLDSWLENSPDEEILLTVYDEYIGASSYEDNMKSFGKVSHDAPTSISIYTDSFDDKDAVAQCIANYNAGVPEETKITYTDYISLMTSSITTIINTISYAIIAFVAISLVVSSIMICVITHISVMERTKEIGILRALGASKRNISQVFNAETVIIGFCSGILGILVSLLLLIPINAILGKLITFSSLTANLPLTSALILVLLSIVITFLGGLIPSKKAANKDPVTALRTE